MANKLHVDAPAVSPAIGGLLPLANVITADADRAAYFGVNHDAVLTGHSRVAPTDGSDKIADQIEQMEGVEFVAYRLIEDALLLGGTPESVAEAEFNNAESYAVEDAVQRLILNDKAVDITPTPGTPVTDARHALGLLEQWIGQNYSGRPLIHANRFAVQLIPELQVGSNFELHTVQGTPIANGAGYSADGPGVVNAAAGTAWLYISGQVNLWAGKLNVVEGPALKANRDYGLAERSYAATVSGPVAAILVGTN